MKPKFYSIIIKFIIIVASLFFAGEGYGQGYIAASRYVDSTGYNYYGNYYNNFNNNKTIINNGETYILGYEYCDSNCPITFGGTTDIKITKLDIYGSVIWSKFLGGSLDESGFDIKFHNGTLYIVGYTNSLNYPVTNGTVFTGIGSNTVYTKLDGLTGMMQFSTYLNLNNYYGGVLNINVTDNFIYISGDKGNSIYISGGPNYTYNATGGDGVVVSKFSNISNTLINTFVIDSCSLNIDWDNGIKGEVEVIGNDIYMVCMTKSQNFPVTNGSVLRGLVDMVYIKLNATTGAINLAGYIGGSMNTHFPGLDPIVSLPY